MPRDGVPLWWEEMTITRAVFANALSKNHATPVPRVPTETSATNDRRCYDCRCHHNRRRRCDYDRPSIRLTSSIRTAVKAGTTSAGSSGAVAAYEGD